MSKSKNVVKKLTTILFTLVSIFAIGLTNVNAEATDITEINLTGNYQIGNVPAGILQEFNPGTTTAIPVIDETNSNWVYKTQYGTWSGFGSETPVAYNDGKTEYGYVFAVHTGTTYQLASGVKVKYNGVDVTSTTRVSTRFPWGNYVYVDLGKAKGENPPTHTVTFESNGGKEIAPKKVVSGLKIIAPSTPTKDKYLFRGWYEDSKFSKEFDFDTPITSDMTLYAKWEAVNFINEIRLAGDIQYGNVPVGTLPSFKSFNPRTNTTGASINDRNSGWMERKKATPSWQGFGSEKPVAKNDGTTDYGYRFAVHVNAEAAYQLASDLQVFYNGEDVTLTANVSPYPWGAYVIVNLGKANETPVTYTVTFNSNGGSGTMAPVTDLTGEFTLPANKFTAPSGKQFKGWSLTADGAIVTKVAMTENRTVYAIWESIPVTYTVSFAAGGGTGTMADVTGVSGDYVLPVCGFTAPNGQQFKAWSVGGTEKAVGDKISVSANTTVTAIWEAIEYDVAVTAGTASAGAGAPITKATMGTTVTLTAGVAPLGQMFDKWVVNGTVIADAKSATTTFVMPAGKVDATATYKNIPVVTYTVSFGANGGTGSMADATAVSGEYTLPANGFTAPAGKQFKAWSVGGTEKAVGDKITVSANTTVTAIWEAIEYDVAVTAGTASAGTGAPITKATMGTTVTLTAGAAPLGQMFDKWVVNGVVVADAKSATTTFVMPASKVTATATYKNIPVVTYTVSFGANGGTDTMADAAAVSGDYVLPACGFTAPAGKQFKAWSVGGVKKAVGDKISVSANTTVTAIWEAIPAGHTPDNKPVQKAEPSRTEVVKKHTTSAKPTNTKLVKTPTNPGNKPSDNTTKTEDTNKASDDTSKTGDTNKASGDVQSTQTDDNSMTWLWTALLFAGGFGVVAITVIVKKISFKK